MILDLFSRYVVGWMISGDRSGGQEKCGRDPAVEVEQAALGIDLGHPAVYEVGAALLPEAVFVGLGVLVAHMPHGDVHEGGAGVVVLGLAGNHGDPPVRLALANAERCGYPGNAVSQDCDVHFSSLAQGSGLQCVHF